MNNMLDVRYIILLFFYMFASIYVNVMKPDSTSQTLCNFPLFQKFASWWIIDVYICYTDEN